MPAYCKDSEGQQGLQAYGMANGRNNGDKQEDRQHPPYLLRDQEQPGSHIRGFLHIPQ